MQLDQLALKYARMQHAAVHLAQTDPDKLRLHIAQTLRRCLPACIVTNDLIGKCLSFVNGQPEPHDPMHTRSIHAFAGQHLLNGNGNDPLWQRLHKAASELLAPNRPATRDDLRLVTIAALYEPAILPAGTHTAYLRYRLGLGVPRLSNEEIAVRLHKPLVYIHELEAAVLTILTRNYSGGPYA